MERLPDSEKLITEDPQGCLRGFASIPDDVKVLMSLLPFNRATASSKDLEFLVTRLVGSKGIWTSPAFTDQDGRICCLGLALAKSSIPNLGDREQDYPSYLRLLGEGKALADPGQWIAAIYPHDFQLGSDYWSVGVHATVTEKGEISRTSVPIDIKLVRTETKHIEITRGYSIEAPVFSVATGDAPKWTPEKPVIRTYTAKMPFQGKTLILSLLCRYSFSLSEGLNSAVHNAKVKGEVSKDLEFLVKLDTEK